MSAPPFRRRVPMGEAAGIVFTSGSHEAQGLATAVRASNWAGVEDVVPAAESVGILVDPERASVAEVVDLAAGLTITDAVNPTRRIDVEVCFDGSDLDAVAVSAGMAVDDVIACLESAELTVGWLGFMPGFPYLVGLPAPLASVGRLERPRARVPAGAFAIADGCAGIYPTASPGGWNLLGSTGLDVFDAQRAAPAMLAPGDDVRVRAVGSVVAPRTRQRAPITAGGPRRVMVIEAGALTLVQDRGRFGVAHLGVPPAGPADPLRHAIANIAVGNSPDCAALEITASGATLGFGCDAFVALVGECQLRIDGRGRPPATTQLVQRGQTVAIGAVRRGLRSYLGISGGLEVPATFGSRSSDAVTGIWPGPLRNGDELDLGTPGRGRGRWFEPANEQQAVLRVSRGPDGSAEAFETLLGCDWEVAVESNRVGARLRHCGSADSPGPETAGRAVPKAVEGFPSCATVVGAVQVPPDGCPVVLGPDHGTVGGYPVVAVVARSSLSTSGQLVPGDVLRFEESHGAALPSVTSIALRSVMGWMGRPEGR